MRRYLTDSVASFQCRAANRYYGGDHIIFLGAVEAYAYNRAGAAAVCARRLWPVCCRRRQRVLVSRSLKPGRSYRYAVSLRHLCTIPVANFTGCHQCNAVVIEHIVEQRLQIFDAMRHRRDVGRSGLDRGCDRSMPRQAFLELEYYSAALEPLDWSALIRGMTFSAIRIIDCRPSSRSFQSLPA